MVVLKAGKLVYCLVDMKVGMSVEKQVALMVDNLAAPMADEMVATRVVK